MLKKLFSGVAIFALLSLACFAAVLFYSKHKTVNFPMAQHIVENDNNTNWKIKQHLEQIWGKVRVTDASQNVTEKVTQKTNPTTKALERCPDMSPKLVGPLHVEFNVERTMEDARKVANNFIHEGGRYKPKECIAQQKVAIVIPFRNRHEHLIHWLYYLHPILMRQQLDYGVYVINQDGEGVFNRAKLMNVGYVEALKEYDYECFVFSDIDLVPLDDRNLYRCFNNPRHLAVAMDKFDYHLPYNTYFGGVSSLSKEQYLKINGFPNTYWGWGGEDDDIYRRVIFRGMSISRPDSLTGKYKMVKHNRDKHNDPNPKNPGKLSQTQSTMDTDGFNSLKYTVKNIEKDLLYTYITVDIEAPPS